MPPSWLAQEPVAALRLRHGAEWNSALHTRRCGRLAAASLGRHDLFPQYVTASWRILDTPGVGQYGPRGFEGGNPGNLRRGCRPMSDNSRNEERETPPEEAALSARLKRLGERLDQSNASRSPDGSASRTATDHSGFARGFRLSCELVAGVLVDSGIGWLIDRGSGPCRGGCSCSRCSALRPACGT